MFEVLTPPRVLASVPDLATASSAACDAVLRLRGAVLAAELGRIASQLTASPQARFVAGRADAGARPRAGQPGAWHYAVETDGVQYGYFEFTSAATVDEAGQRALASLATLIASLMQMQSLAQRSTHAYVQVEAKLAHQSQILDQIHESVLTMDKLGYITSWNRGAEDLFGYTALEAIGRSILFLYADDDLSERDLFAEEGGRLMEVRRRKKSGAIFWASLSLSTLCDLEGRPVGLIAYLTDITERKQAEDRLHHLAYYDALTGMPNRTLFARLVDQALMVAQRNEAAGCVLFVDLNRFKLINDTLGRSVGDELLRQVSQRFRTTLRDEDLVARLSGDEFAVGLFEIRQHFEATTVAQKLQAALLPPFKVQGYDLRVGASVGISVYPADGTDAETLLRHADIASERAKQDHANPDDSVAFYSLDMNQGMQERMRIESGLRHALGHGELTLYFQPKFAIATNQLVGAEALVRWIHPVRGMIAPVEFIPLAETTGLIVQVGEWVLEAACAQAAVWQHAGMAPFRLAVNVSAREFTAGLPNRVASTLARYSLDPAWLELEITESTLMHDIERVIGIMDRINDLGVALSLDDFGTGYSSLSYLKRFPIDTLKIDKSFTMGIPGDASDCAIASAIISIGRQLGHRVIAEGVETVEQLAFLRASGCDEVQGYLYSRPLSACDFEKGLRENWLLVE
ncbi:putative bifunctional diguanylate cyclase/phosphodiesterase [Massilia sp. S19_KUP03_FR1]|uniref:putative bifunctional diguanylate cyclase/phosphodiesterase n=1 Tax=Massilia sp. S19_KUP03_FR1 TaxID=3025503 RepID=UPI002FCDD8C7